MNVPANQTAAPPEATQPAAARPDRSAALRRFGEEFARLLLAKTLPQPGAEAETQPAPVDPAPIAAAFGWMPPPQFSEPISGETAAPLLDLQPGAALPPGAGDAKPSAPIAPAPAAPATQPVEVSAPRAAIEAALKGDALPAVPAMVASETVWEASVYEPGGVAVQMRATHSPVAQAGAAQAQWTLTIASPALESAVLAQHAPRLAERLRSRSIEKAELRFEDEDSEAD